MVYERTQGNPFFTTQFLKGLHADDSITFDRDLGYWQCDLVRVRDASLTNDVLQFMVGRLHKLPTETQDVLKLAACIGNQFDLDILAVVCQQSAEDIANDLWKALQEGLVLPQSDAYKFFYGQQQDDELTETVMVGYRFLHDRVQQAAYSLIPDADKKSTHRKIGQRLLSISGPDTLEETIFAIVEQLNAGIDLVEARDEALELANLNMIAGKRAKASIAYSAAIDYFETAISILPQNCWETHYPLTLDIFVSRLESYYLNTNFEVIEDMGAALLEKTKTLLDEIKIYEIKIRAWIGRGDQHQALETGLEVLKLLGIPLREKRPEAVTDISGLVKAPAMDDPHQLAAMKIMEFIITPAWAVSGEFFQKVTFTMAELSLRYGNCASSAFGYVWYGTLLCEALGDIDAGYEFGQLSIALLDRFHAEELRSRVLVLYASCIGFWKEHVKGFLATHLEGLQSGLDTGDLEFASYGAAEYSQYLFLIAASLDKVRDESQQKLAIIQYLKQDFHVDYLAPWLQGTLNLLGENGAPDKLEGVIFSEETRLPILLEQKQLTLVFCAYFVKSFLSYMFGNPQKAVEEGMIAREHVAGVAGTLFVPTEMFYSSLARLACLIQGDEQDIEGWEQDTLRCLAKLKHWAKYAPMNYQHKCDLIEAELAHSNQDVLRAIEHYDRAIAGAKENDYIQEEALANELFSKFYLDWGRNKEAALYMQEAYYCYARWGAKAKVKHLEANYPQLLGPILEKRQLDLNALESLDSLTQTLTTSGDSQTHSSTNLSDAIDFSSILQAAQKLSQTIELDKLLCDITNIVLTSTGAQKMVLLTASDIATEIGTEQSLHIQAIAERADGNVTTNSTTQPLTSESPVPIRLIQYVKNTQTSVSRNNADTDLAGVVGDYLLKHQPESILCVPLLNQGNLLAIAYLEHPTTKDVFTPNCQTIVEFLCAQAAVALQNAQLYRQAQDALTDLQQAQIQLVNSEKMSALGNLVSGVAHEINNPVGFLQGNIQPAQDYVQDLLGLIDLYQEQFPEPGDEIEDEIDAIDLEFVREDLPNLIGSMSTGVDRIRNISTSLRTFSRTDRESKTAFDIHDGLDSTLLILKHRTKANEERPAIEIVKQYGELPEVNCFPGQLNQVFMNLFANAIDAFEENNCGKSYQDIEQNPNQIAIRTSVVDDRVQIEIRDNGCGMTPETAARIFEQGFTTKAVGKGTGVGMAIAHQIVTEKHGGAITCHSRRGEGATFVIALPLTI